MTQTAQASIFTLPIGQPLVIKQRHEQILETVSRLRFVTVADIQKLHFTYPTESKHAYKLLNALSGGADYHSRQYLLRFPKPDTSPGNPTKIYTLGSLGVAYLRRQLHLKVNWSFHPDKLRRLGYFPCQHALTLTSFLVEIQACCQKSQTLRLARMLTQYDLPSLFGEHLPQAQGQLAYPVPDAFLDLEYLNEDRTHLRFMPVLLEIDRATEYQRSFRTHLLARLAFIKPEGAFRKLFGINSVKVAYLTIGGAERLRHMMAWTKEVLSEQNKNHWQRFFYFCSLPLGEFDGYKLLHAPIWYRLNGKRPISLTS